jgi:DNA polymerase III subunit epsilon
MSGRTAAVPCFVALDFETASYARDSACEIGLVRVENGKVAASKAFFIRPPSREFYFTWLHGIDWEKVKDAPTFAGLLPKLRPLLDGADFIAAHNASFDRSVMSRTCERYGLDMPPHPFVCTVEVARDVWSIYPTKLPNVCQSLGIDLGHHHSAEHDALACARIVQHAIEKIGADRFAARFM